MKKSTVHLVNALKAKLLEFPKLVNKLENKDLDFIHQYTLWLRNCEEVLATYHISNVSELSGIRSKIIATKYADSPSSSSKKLLLKAAADTLFDAQQIVLNVLTPYEAKIEESKELIRQLLVIVGQTKAIQFDKKQPLDHLIHNVWNFILSNDQLKAGAVKLRTTIPMTDITLLIAEEIDLEDF